MKTHNKLHQVDGNHYERFEIEPVNLFSYYDLNWFQGEAIKYPSRFPNKGGYRDLQKAIHVMQMAIDMYPKPLEDEDSIKYKEGEEGFTERYINQFKDNYFMEPKSFFIFKHFIYSVLNKNYRKAKHELELLISSEYESFHFKD